MLLETSIYAQINLLCLHAVNGTLRCAPHGKRESESGRNAERASSSQQHDREGATRVEPHAGASGSHLRRWLLLGKVVPGSATRQSNHQRSILKEMTLPAFESTHGAREPVSMKGGRRAGQLLKQPLRCDTKRLGSAGGAGTAHLLEQRPRPAGGGAEHASARQSGVSRHAADTDYAMIGQITTKANHLWLSKIEFLSLKQTPFSRY